MKINPVPYLTGIAIIGATACLTLAIGCSAIGSNPTPPTRLESKLFDISTNFTPVVVTRTNVVTATNVVNVPSPFGVPIFQTNLVNTTNLVTLTNEIADYQYTTKPAAVATIQAVGSASGPFTAGIGTMVGGGLAVLYGLWAQLRSTKKGNTNVALTQEIEAVRDFILTLPQGAKIDAAVTQFMQQHQMEAGVAQEVMKLIKDNTSDPTVVGVATQLQAAINDLTNPPAAPNPPKMPAS